jgi:hypothetical protein
MVGIDRNKMRIFDVESEAQTGISNHTPFVARSNKQEKDTSGFVF